MTHIVVGREGGHAELERHPQHALRHRFPWNGPGSGRSRSCSARTRGTALKAILMLGGAGEYQGAFVGAASSARTAPDLRAQPGQPRWGTTTASTASTSTGSRSSAPTRAPLIEPLAQDLRRPDPTIVLTLPVTLDRSRTCRSRPGPSASAPSRPSFDQHQHHELRHGGRVAAVARSRGTPPRCDGNTEPDAVERRDERGRRTSTAGVPGEPSSAFSSASTAPAGRRLRGHPSQRPRARSRIAVLARPFELFRRQRLDHPDEKCRRNFELAANATASSPPYIPRSTRSSRYIGANPGLSATTPTTNGRRQHEQDIAHVCAKYSSIDHRSGVGRALATSGVLRRRRPSISVPARSRVATSASGTSSQTNPHPSQTPPECSQIDRPDRSSRRAISLVRCDAALPGAHLRVPDERARLGTDRRACSKPTASCRAVFRGRRRRRRAQHVLHP